VSPLTPIVSAQPPLTFPAVNTNTYSDPQVLWTLPGTSSAIIEAVSVFVDTGAASGMNAYYVLRLVDLSGAVLFTQSSPILDWD